MSKIRKLANAEHTPETMQLSSKADKVLLPWKQLKHSNTGAILKVQPYQLKGLEKVNGIQFYDIQSTITEGSETSRAIKKTITKGRCRDLEFILTRCSDTKGTTSIDIQVDVDHASSLSHFLQATIKSNDLSLFFRSIKRYARVIEKRKKIFEEVLCNYSDHVVMPKCAHPSSFYFLPMKNNPQFQLMFLWDILVEDNGSLHQKISLLPLLSKKCVYFNVQDGLIIFARC